MLKIMTIVGTRPEIIKMCCVIKELEKYCDHILVHTGQNYDYELNQVFFDDLGLTRPNHFLNVAVDNVAETIGNVIVKADQILELEKPDAILLYGDTNSCLSVISAKRRKIPVFHMEAGNRCFDQRVPEELNRKVVDHLAAVIEWRSIGVVRLLLPLQVVTDPLSEDGWQNFSRLFLFH